MEVMYVHTLIANIWFPSAILKSMLDSDILDPTKLGFFAIIKYQVEYDYL